MDPQDADKVITDSAFVLMRAVHLGREQAEAACLGLLAARPTIAGIVAVTLAGTATARMYALMRSLSGGEAIVSAGFQITTPDGEPVATENAPPLVAAHARIIAAAAARDWDNAKDLFDGFATHHPAALPQLLVLLAQDAHDETCRRDGRSDGGASHVN